MCRYIYFSVENNNIVHERVCAEVGHGKHVDIYENGKWNAAQGLVAI